MGSSMGPAPGESVKQIIRQTSDQLNQSNADAAESSKAYQEAYQQHLIEVANNRKVLDDVLKEDAGMGRLAKYPAISAGVVLAVVLAVLQIFNVNVADEDITSIKTILEFAVPALGPIVAGYFVHRQVSPVPPQLKGN